MKFTVDRSKWVNANHGQGFSQLLNEKGFRCCLGFCQAQLNVPDELLLTVSTPARIASRACVMGLPPPPADNIFNELNTTIGLSCTSLTREAMCINDSSFHSNETRERRLQEIFLEAGHEIEFIGEFQD